MLHPYRPEESVDFYSKYYTAQAGNGLSVYEGKSLMPANAVGYGFGSILSGLFKSALPVLKRTAISAGKNLVKAGVSAADDVLSGKNTKESIKQTFKSAGRNILNESLNSNSNSRKRKSSQKNSQTRKKRSRKNVIF